MTGPGETLRPRPFASWRAFGAAVRDVVVRTALLAVVWWAISEGQPEAAPFGAVAVVLGVAASFALAPGRPRRLWLLAVLRFVPYFLWQSLRGGADVVRRACHPALPLAPGVVDYPFRLEGERPRVAMALILSLLPGTLAVHLPPGSDLVRIHALDTRLPVMAAMAELEARIGAVFGQRLKDTPAAREAAA